MEEEFETGNIELSFGGVPLSFQLTVPKNKVKLRRMLPIFQKMTNSFLEIGVAKVNSEGKEISCVKGCGACCNQLVPLAEAEAFQIAELVEQMPEPRKSQVKQRFADACQHFMSIGWFKRIDKNEELSDAERAQIVSDYFKEGIPCPFLEDQSCSIHLDRPLVCREYLVTSPAEFCSNPTVETIEKVKILFSISETFMKLEDNPKTINFVPLIMALVWAEKSQFKPLEKTGQEWVGEFFKELMNQDA